MLGTVLDAEGKCLYTILQGQHLPNDVMLQETSKPSQDSSNGRISVSNIV